MTPSAPELDSAVFRALGDPTRRALLDRLGQRNGQTLAELCAGQAMSRQAVSGHLAQLEAAGLIATQWRGREKLHFLDVAPINALADRWISRFDRRRAEALADLKTALEATMSEFVYTTYIKTSPEQLWKALIDPAFTQQYWGVGLESEWKVGSTVSWTFAGITMSDAEQIVLECDRPRRLAYTWHTFTDEFYEAIGATPDQRAAFSAEDRSHVAFDLEAVSDGLVKLTVTHGGFKEGSVVLTEISGGWPPILSSLKTLLETGEPLVRD